jgi:hypothetical protein
LAGKSLDQDAPERHPDLELEDLEKKLAKTPESTPMLRKFLETRIAQLKSEIRNNSGIKSRKVEAKFGPAKQAKLPEPRQDKPTRWEPPNRPLTIEDLKIRRAIKAAVEEEAKAETTQERKEGKMNSFVEHYASLPQEDLHRLSLDVQSLTPQAREALRQEMRRRQISTEAVDWTAQPEQVSDLQRIGGWLLFYCVCAVVFLPIWMLVALPQGPLWVALLLLPSGVIQVGSGLLLWRRNPSGLRWVRCGLLYLLAVFLLSFLLSLASLNPQAILYCVVGSLPSIVWWKYFRKSQRVHAVFGRNMDGFPAIFCYPIRWKELSRSRSKVASRRAREVTQAEPQEARTKDDGFRALEQNTETNMNFNEGARRLAIFAGVLGMVAGGIYAYKDLRDVPSERFQHKVFEHLAASDLVRQERAKLRLSKAAGLELGWPITSSVIPEVRGVPPGLTADPLPGQTVEHEPRAIDMNGDRIKTIFWNQDFSVDFFVMEDGGYVTSEPSPSILSYLLGVAFPALGFLTLWGAIRGIGWVGAGFFQTSK